MPSKPSSLSESAAFTVHGAKVIQQPGQRAWVTMPDRPWTGADGKIHYTPILELSPSLKQRVAATVLSSWEQAPPPAEAR